MAQVLIIGAAGKVGSRLGRQLSQASHRVYGLHRKAEQAKLLKDSGVIPLLGDLATMSIPELSGHMQGLDTVVFTAGAGGAGTSLTEVIDGKGLMNAADAAKSAGVKRFILVSAFPDAWRAKRMPETFEHYMHIKRQADVYLAATDLNWAILRPGTLTDDAGTGLVRAGLAIPYGSVPRDDVAEALAALVESPSLKRVIIELTSGENQVVEALEAVG